MHQIQLSDDDTWAYTQAMGAVASARFALDRLVQQILAKHGVDPKTPHQIDGNVLTVAEDPNA